MTRFTNSTPSRLPEKHRGHFGWKLTLIGERLIDASGAERIVLQPDPELMKRHNDAEALEDLNRVINEVMSPERYPSPKDAPKRKGLSVVRGDDD